MSWLCTFFFSSRRRHTIWPRDWSSDVCSSDLGGAGEYDPGQVAVVDLAAGAGEGVVRGEGAVGGGDVHELRVGGDVAGGPDAWVGGAQVVVDDDLAALAGAHVDGVEAERAGDRAAARGDEDLGDAELL